VIQPSIDEFFSPKIYKIFIGIFIGVAFINFVIFSVAEFNESKRAILKELKHISTATSNSISVAVWKNDKFEIGRITNSLLQNREISAIQIINYDNKHVETNIIKNGRSPAISKTTDIFYTYNDKEIKVAKLTLFTDNWSIWYRIEKPLLLLFLKTLIETFTIVFLIFWAFKKLFAEYISAIRFGIQHNTKSDDKLEISSSLRNIENKFQTMLNHLINIYLKRKTNESEEEKKEKDEKKEKEELKEISEIEAQKRFHLEKIINFLNPNREIFKKYFREMFVSSQAVHTESGDIYLFSEIEKNQDLLLIMVDYEYSKDINSFELALIMKDIEKDILLKHSVNNRIFSTAKVLEFTEKRIRSKFIENGIQAIEDVEFKGLIAYFDRKNQKIDYSSKGVFIFQLTSTNLNVFDDYGLYSDRMATGIPEDDKREFSIDTSSKDDVFYIATDGYFRQIKRDKRREEIGKNGFTEVLNKIKKEPFTSQKDSFLNEFNLRKGDKKQVEDVTIIGLKF
jgi:hypothetical protein